MSSDYKEDFHLIFIISCRLNVKTSSQSLLNVIKTQEEERKNFLYFKRKMYVHECKYSSKDELSPFFVFLEKRTEKYHNAKRG